MVGTVTYVEPGDAEWEGRSIPDGDAGFREAFGFVRGPDLDVRFPGGAGLTFTCDLAADAGRHFPAAGPVPSEPPWFEEPWAG